MIIETFNELRAEFDQHERELLDSKKQEYATNDDCLLNFRQISAFTFETMPQVAMFGLLKHIQSLVLAIQNNNFSNWAWTPPDGGEGLKQRIADARNYLLLLAACIEEMKSD